MERLVKIELYYYKKLNRDIISFYGLFSPVDQEVLMIYQMTAFVLPFILHELI